MSPACPVFGFRVTVSGHDAARLDQLEHELLAAITDPRGLILDRVNEGLRRTLMVRSEAGQATNADRQAVIDWARQHRDVAIGVGEIEDVGTLA